MPFSPRPPIPVLRIFDVALAESFYGGYLGFTIDWTHRFAPGMPAYIQVTRGALVLHLSEHFGDASPGACLYIPVDSVDGLHAELSAMDYAYQRPGIVETRWGTREMTLTDPFGNRLRFAEAETGVREALPPAEAPSEAPVSLRTVVDEMSSQDSVTRAYINRKTGDVSFVSAQTGVVVGGPVEPDEGGGPAPTGLPPDGDWLPLPADGIDYSEFNIMARYCDAIDDLELKDRLLEAIEGRGAFRRFKSLIHRGGIQDDWATFRKRSVAAVAAEFLDTHAIPFVDDLTDS